MRRTNILLLSIIVILVLLIGGVSVFIVAQLQNRTAPTDFETAFSYALPTFVYNVLVYWAIVSVTLAISCTFDGFRSR